MTASILTDEITTLAQRLFAEVDQETPGPNGEDSTAEARVRRLCGLIANLETRVRGLERD